MCIRDSAWHFSRHRKGCAGGGPRARRLCGPWRRARQAWLFPDTRGGAQGVVPERGAYADHCARHARRDAPSTAGL
eukprot:9476389-Pyramimonas_sp.AAC.1